MLKLVTAILGSIALVAGVGAAEAASCKTRSLEGVWVGHATDEADLYCLLQFTANGQTRQSSCFNPKTLKPTATLDGALTVNAACKVSGSFTFHPLGSGQASPATFKGKLIPDKAIMNGDFVIFGQNEDYRFVRQLD